MPTKDRNFLFLTVFIAGMTTLAIEFTTSRMMQTVYGTSNIVWANVIGLVLFFLTVGYFLGGRLADKYPSPKYFYLLVSLSGFSSIFFLLLTSTLLKSTALGLASLNMGAIIGSLVSVCIALAVPITLLGCMSPFAIRLGVRNVEEAGRVSGRIYAISTWGSLLGTYLPVLYVIPTTGSRMTTVIFGSILLAVGLVGYWRESKNLFAVALAPLLIAPVIFAWTGGNIKSAQGQLYETESQYNYIQVVRRGSCNYLQLNEGVVIHSEYCDGGVTQRLSVWSYMLVAPFFNDPKFLKDKLSTPIQSLAVVGLGAGTLPQQFLKSYGNIHIDGIELDSKIVEVGQKYFDMNSPNLNVIIGDGRYELNQLTGTYDTVAIDAYKLPYIPWHLCTKEFFEEVKAHLTDHGTVAINVGRTYNDTRMVEAMTATLLQVFPSVHTLNADSTNSVLIATVQETTDAYFRQNVKAVGKNGPALLLRSLAAADQRLAPSKAADVIFTDEVAPVETITDSIVLNFMLQSKGA